MGKNDMKLWGYKLARKNKKPKKRTVKRKKSDLSGLKQFLPYVAGIVAVIALTSVGLYNLHLYFTTSETFRIKRVEVNEPLPGTFSRMGAGLEMEYVGKNIFSVSPSRVETLIREDHSYLETIRVRRVFPDTLEVDLIPRESFAFLDISGGIVVDRTGMILSVGETPGSLTAIKGALPRLSRPARGDLITDNRLQGSLLLLASIVDNSGIDPRDINSLDISDMNNSVVTVRGVPVNMGRDDFSEKVEKLGEIFNDPRISPQGIRYIDLRFRDPVYSYKR